MTRLIGSSGLFVLTVLHPHDCNCPEVGDVKEPLVLVALALAREEALAAHRRACVAVA